jgi:tetratricopeptide (TPR) repeat protein
VFGALKEWWERRRALRELRASEDEGSQGFRKFFVEQILDARSSLIRGDRPLALRIWRDMNERFPKLILTSDEALNLLVDLGQYDEADALVRTGRKRYPRYRLMYAAIFARAAQGRGDADETLRRCAILRRKFPHSGVGYTVAASCLSSLGRQEDAEAMIEQGVRKVPGSYEISVAYARHAERRRDWPRALDRWKALKDRFDEFLGPVGMAQSLRETGRYLEATEIALEASVRFPKSPWADVELARIAAAQGDLEGTARRWQIARERFPDFPVAYIAGAEAERRIGREAEADKILNLAVARMRFDLGVHLEYARSADRRGDLAAAERWSLVRDRFPTCQEAQDHKGDHVAAKAPATEDGTGLP